MKIEIGNSNWYGIEKNCSSYGNLNAHRVDGALEMWLAIDHNGYRHMILPLNNIEDLVTDKKSRGITVEGRILVINSATARLYIDITCIDKDGYNVFNLLAIEIAEKINDKVNIIEAVTTTISRWRKFWAAGSKAVLTDEQVKGLFGELWFLLVWLFPKGLDYYRGWHGPTGSRHDFQFNSLSVEVKTTTSTRGHIHRVNGLGQLDPTESGELYVYSLRLRRENLASNTLPLLVQKISEILSSRPELLENFNERLLQVGYLREYDEIYVEHKFMIIDERLYVVDEKFPRLSLDYLEDGLPNGVENVSYEINLEVCPENCICREPNFWDPVDL